MTTIESLSRHPINLTVSESYLNLRMDESHKGKIFCFKSPTLVKGEGPLVKRNFLDG